MEKRKQMNQKALLLMNYSSGTGNQKNRLPEIIEQLSLAGYQVTVAPINPGRKLFANDILREAGESFDLFFCCGGDGTLHHLVNSIQKYSLKGNIAYLPSGSANDFAASLYHSRSVTVPQLISAIIKDQHFDYDLCRFNDRFFNYVAAFGSFTKVSYTTDQNLKNSLGYLAYVVSVLGSLDDLSYRRHAVIEYDEGKVIEGDFVLGAISNTTSIGGISSPMFRDSKLDDGIFEVTLISAFNNISQLSDVVNSLVAGKPDGNMVKSFTASRISITFDQPAGWSLDGENGGETVRANLEIGDWKQRIYVPDNK